MLVRILIDSLQDRSFRLMALSGYLPGTSAERHTYRAFYFEQTYRLVSLQWIPLILRSVSLVSKSC